MSETKFTSEEAIKQAEKIVNDKDKELDKLDNNDALIQAEEIVFEKEDKEKAIKDRAKEIVYDKASENVDNDIKEYEKNEKWHNWFDKIAEKRKAGGNNKKKSIIGDFQSSQENIKNN